LKALMTHGGLRRDIDPRAVEDYFALGYVPEPRTIFTSALKLAPGQHAVPAPRPTGAGTAPLLGRSFTAANKISARDAQAELLERLNESVRLRMIAEVPLGAFLSGGVDSSAVVCDDGWPNQWGVNTCSIAFDDPAYDETAFAQQVAERYRTRISSTVSRPTTSISSTLWPRSIRALCRQLRDPDLPRVPAGSKARDRGTVR